MWAIGLIVGGLIGAAVGNSAGASLGAIVGLVCGIWVGRDRKLRYAKIADLELHVSELSAEVASLRDAVTPRFGAGLATAASEVARNIASDAAATTSLPSDAGAPAANAASVADTDVAAMPLATHRHAIAVPVRKRGVGSTQSMPAEPARETDTNVVTIASPKPAWLRWLIGGNSLARMGVLILFIGVAFLLKFTAERVVVPVELRLAGVTLGAIVLLMLGWRLRTSRPGYAMILQGGGVGVMYLTIFAALKLYALLPPTAAFALLFLVAAFSSLLATRQDAVALAALGVVGGFLAPILTANGSGSHVVLFSYYALLDASILAVAWFRAWRVLNILGFVFTFAVAVAWGVTKYRPELFASTEPFLVLAFLFYVAIAVLYALRQSVALRDYVDSTLVFGTPLLVGGLQSGLVRDMPFGMAFSTLVAAALYLALAKALYHRRDESARMLVQAFLALGVMFATLAIPLALDARWTSATWALEGAALLWIGVRQDRRSTRVFGALLQLAAGIALGLGLQVWRGQAPTHPIPLLNSDCIGAILLALSGLASAWLLQPREQVIRPLERVASALLFAWGTAWWMFAGWHEIDRWLPANARLAAVVGFVTLTALLFVVVDQVARWPIARIPVLAALPALLLLAIGAAGNPTLTVVHLFAHGGFLTWPMAVIAMLAVLKHYDGPNALRGAIAAPLDWWHGGLLWLVALLVAQELAWAGTHVGSGEGIWSTVSWGLAGAAVLFAVVAFAEKPVWPMYAHRVGYLIFGAVPIAISLAWWSIRANFDGDGDPAPLAYFPLFNPLDIAEVLALLALATWVLHLQRDGTHPGDLLRPTILGAALAALLFVWINGVVLRTIHFGWDVSYILSALWASRLVQVALSLLWSSLALATMVFANRRLWRVAWVTGAMLLAIVVIKLFLVDLSQVGGIERIVSFIGVGALLLLIGFLAPVPPRRLEAM